MKAMRAHQAGGPEQLRYEDAPEPQLGDAHVRIRVRAIGINPADLVRLSGKLAPLQFPSMDQRGHPDKNHRFEKLGPVNR